MAQSGDYYRPWSSLEKGCEHQNRSLLEGHDLHYAEYAQQHLSPHWEEESNRPTVKRILLACCKGLVLGLAVSGLLHSLRFFWRRTHFRPPFPPEVGFTVPKEAPQLQCVHSENWTDYFDQPDWSVEPYGARTSFSLPVDADSLYLLSRGINQMGNLKITQSSEESDVVNVDIRVAYRSEDSLDLVNVCLTGGAENEYGVSILTPPHRSYRSGTGLLHFDVELTLPAMNHGSNLGIKKLKTHLPTYSQNMAGLSETVSFGEVSLASANGHITIDSVAAGMGSFMTSNGDVSGHFEGESLRLTTINGHINATVALLNREGTQHSKLVMHTANGHVTAEVALISDANAGGNFGVAASSTNGFVDLAFTESPIGSVLKAKAVTTSGEVKVAVPNTYEGSYVGTTLVGKVFVMEQDFEDPEGKGRRREVVSHRVGNRVDGTVYWVESDGSHAENESLVTASTTVSSVNLVI